MKCRGLRLEFSGYTIVLAIHRAVFLRAVKGSDHVYLASLVITSYGIAST